MSDQGRRQVCRSLFLLAGVCPLAVSLGWAAWRHVVSPETAYENWLAAQLAVDVRLSDVTRPKPGLTRIGTAKIVNPETGQMLALCERLELRWGVRGIGIHAAQTHLSGDVVGELGELLHDRLLCRRRLHETSIFLVSQRVAIQRPRAEVELRECRLDVQRAADGPTATLTFQWAYAEQPQPVRVRLSRHQKSNGPITRLELETGNNPLPCSVLFGAPAWLAPWEGGDSLTFQGALWLDIAQTGWEGELTGHISGIDLNRLFTDRFPHQVSGDARMVVERAVVREGRLVELQGQLRSGPGTVGKPLVQAAVRYLGCRLPTRLGVDESIEYRKLAVDIRLDNAGLVIHGMCEPDAPGNILVDAAGAVLVEPEDQPRLAIDVVRMLADEERAERLWDESTAGLMRVLPVHRD